MVLLEPESELARQLVVALAAHRPQVHLEELGLVAEQPVAGGAAEVVRAPGLAQRREHVALHTHAVSGSGHVAGTCHLYHPVAVVTQRPEQLVVVVHAVGQAVLLIVSDT